MYNQKLAERSLPVILSTQWTLNHDHELQEMLGYYSLCTFVFYKADRHRSVYLGACPVHFALYLKSRCAAAELLLEQLEIYGDEYIEHGKVCECDGRVKTGVILTDASFFSVVDSAYSKYSSLL